MTEVSIAGLFVLILTYYLLIALLMYYSWKDSMATTFSTLKEVSLEVGDYCHYLLYCLLPHTKKKKKKIKAELLQCTHKPLSLLKCEMSDLCFLSQFPFSYHFRKLPVM